MAQRVTRTVTIADGQIASDTGALHIEAARLLRDHANGALHLPPVAPGTLPRIGRISEVAHA
jgi:hypothetical protein